MNTKERLKEEGRSMKYIFVDDKLWEDFTAVVNRQGSKLMPVSSRIVENAIMKYIDDDKRNTGN